MPDRALLDTTAGRLVAALAGLLVLGVLAGLALLWPHGAAAPRPEGPGAGPIERAHVVALRRGGCERFAGPGCRIAELELRSGPERGERTFLAVPGDRFAPPLEAGDDIRVARNTRGEVGEGAALDDAAQSPALDDPAQYPALDDPAQYPVAFVDFERSSPLLVLALVFVALVVVLGRWHGVRALLGLGLSLTLVVEFLAPAILDERPLVLTALVGALAVMVVTILLSHGVGLKSLAAMLGTAGALLLTTLLAVIAVRGADVTGLSSEQATLLLAGIGGQLSLQGLVVAGMVIGALGVLDDVTVSQASTVLALRRANPALGFRRLLAEALEVGRDHLGATVNTLVLAYAGAALPVLLIFNTEGTPFGEAVNREPVAEQIVAMLVGSIGLIAAVPLTTAIAALLASRMPASAVPPEHHAH
jgi:uncharacterized membrane protein